MRPLLAICSRVSDYPRWLLRLAVAGEVRANERFRVGGASLGLAEVHGESDWFKLDARRALAEGGRRGAPLVQRGPLAMGVGMGAADAGMRVVGAREWFDTGADRRSDRWQGKWTWRSSGPARPDWRPCARCASGLKTLCW